MKTIARASGNPAARARRQKPSTKVVSDRPSSPTFTSQPDSFGNLRLDHEVNDNPRAEPAKSEGPQIVAPRGPSAAGEGGGSPCRSCRASETAWPGRREPATKGESRGCARDGRTDMSKIALVGLGLVGRAWAISFARAGHEVSIWDERPEATDEALTFVNRPCPNSTRTVFSTARRRSTSAPGCAARNRSRKRSHGASHVQENTPEDLEIKRRVFAELDRVAEPDAVLASSTSAILPSLFTEASRVARAASSPIRSTRPI